MSEQLRRHYGVEHWAADQSGASRGDGIGLTGWLFAALLCLVAFSIVASFWFVSIPLGAWLIYAGRKHTAGGRTKDATLCFGLGAVAVLLGLVQLF